jgi:hypothetical protein
MGDAWIGIQHARPIGHMHTGLDAATYTSAPSVAL